jgi:hypothetical protein
MMPYTLRRLAAISIGLFVTVSLVVSVSLIAAPARPAQAASGADFNPGFIISDAVFYNGMTMTAAQIQTFLNAKVPSCTSGYTCLKSFHETTTSQTAKREGCAAYTGQSNESAAQIIYKVATSCGINPKVLLVMLQKEQGLVLLTNPGAGRFTHAMGYACPDHGVCDPKYYGFFYQVYNAAWQFKKYQAQPSFRGYVAGRWNTIQWKPIQYTPVYKDCGTSSVYIQNQATAGLYIYTPYRPNAAALSSMYGQGDSCSSYGNRNFWLYFTDWFGSSTSTASVAMFLVTIGTPTAGNATATVRWTAPASNGGSPITGYQVRALTSGGAVLALTQDVTGNVASVDVTGLTNGTEYTFDVAAVTATDAGTAATRSARSAPVTPSGAAVAGAPTIGTATAGDASVNVSWTPPISAGDSAITGYRVRALTSSGAVVALTQAITGNVASANVNGLVNGTPYSFDVAAVSAIGTGAVSARSVTVTPLAVPDAPTIGTPTAGDAFATVRWTAPASDGGSAITRYTVRALASTGAVRLTQDVAGDAESVVLAGLTNGTAYSFVVAAVNAIGTGASSAASAAVTPVAPTPPGAPGIGNTTAGDASATVRWTAPAFDGNSAITGYRVRALTSTGAAALTQEVTGNVASTVVTGLTNGKAYSFDIVAVNQVGAGLRSARSAIVTPVAPTSPGAPAIGKPTAGSASATVRWTVPASNGGSAITGYRVRALTLGGAVVALTQTVTGNVAAGVVTGLSNGTGYSFDVVAVNAVGAGVRSARSATVTPVAPPAPGVPVIGKPTAGNATATVRWTAPASNGSAITGYRVRALSSNGAVVALTQAVTGNVASMVVTGLRNEQAYSFDVVAVNAGGPGARSVRSATVTPTAATIPTAPTIGQPTMGNASATVRWTIPASNGGSAITGYQVRALTLAGSTVALTQEVAGNVGSIFVTGLTNGTAYSFDVVAVNTAGAGVRSGRSVTVTAQ